MKITRLLGEELSVRNYKKRVVITGVGPVTPVGVGKEAYWESLIQGKSSFRRISFPGIDMSQYRCQIGAPIEGFDLYHFVERSKLSKHLGKASQFAIAATWLALKDAGIEFNMNDFEKEGMNRHTGVYHLKELDSFQIGVVLGVGVEAMDLMEHFHERFLSRGLRGISPFALPNFYLSAVTSHVAHYFSIRGHSYAVSTACASATHD